MSMNTRLIIRGIATFIYAVLVLAGILVFCTKYYSLRPNVQLGMGITLVMGLIVTIYLIVRFLDKVEEYEHFQNMANTISKWRQDNPGRDHYSL